MAKPPEPIPYGTPAPLVRRGSGLAPRAGATREERRTHEELHRQTLAVRVEKIIVSLAAYSVADLAKVVDRIGLDLVQHSLGTMSLAKATLDDEYLAKYREFASHSLGLGLHDLIEIQALAKENVLDIIADSPNFRELPPEHKSWIRRLFGG